MSDTAKSHSFLLKCQPLCRRYAVSSFGRSSYMSRGSFVLFIVFLLAGTGESSVPAG